MIWRIDIVDTQTETDTGGTEHKIHMEGEF